MLVVTGDVFFTSNLYDTPTFKAKALRLVSDVKQIKWHALLN